MRHFNFTIIAIITLGVFAQATSQAQDWNTQSADEQRQIREMRLLEWHAQEQAQRAAQQPQQNYKQGEYQTQNQILIQPQNVSLNKPYQAPATVAPPASEDLFAAANAGNIQHISKLLAQGLDVNAANTERETALHMAAARGHFEAVMLLVRNGANVNAQTVKRWIPLHHAVRFKHPQIVNFLIQRGAWANARTSDGLTAIDMAKNNNDYRLLSIMGVR